MEIIVIAILTLLNGFFSLSEIAIISVKRNIIEKLASEGNSGAKMILKLLKNPEDFLSSIQVAITLIGIISGAYGGIALSDDLTLFFSQLNVFSGYENTLSLILVVGFITYFSIVVGELVPKAIALNNPEKVALFSVHIIKYFSYITYPVIKLLSLSTKILLKIFRIKKKHEGISEDELRFILKSAYKEGILEYQEHQIHNNIFYFSDQNAGSLMTVKKHIDRLDYNDDIEVILNKIKNSIHGKFIVCDGSIEKVIGIVYMKDFMEHYKKNGFSLKKILSKPIFIPKKTSAIKVLDLFKSNKQYIGIVVDDSGKVVGIITIHDLIQAIIGKLPS